ncbi:DEAD/DEAH box helicase [Atopobiaceae bacterium HCP3S3_F7]
MAHVIEYNPETGEWLALVDPAATPPTRAPLTPASKQLNKAPAVFSLPATWTGLVQLLATLPGAVLGDDAAKLAASLKGHVLEAWAGGLTYNHSPGLTPYPWQVAAAVQYARTGRLMLNDEPGTGKTASSVLAVAEVGAAALPVVVVCPASVVTAWVEAWATWAPHVSVGRYMGPKRAKLLADGLDVLVTSYDTMARDVDKLTHALAVERGHVGTVILDEHHLIKNPKAARSKAARKLAGHARGTIVLSGTPITHHPGDLWPALDALEPGAWPSRTRYQARYLDVVQGDYGDEVVGFLPHRRDEFDLCLMPFQRRVSKADALPWLPPKVYQVREVELPAEWRKLYNSMRDELVAALPDNDEPLNAMSVLAQLSYLQALAASPCDVEVSTTVDDDGLETKHYHAKMKPESWKVAELLAVLEEREGESVVVFSPSRQLVELAGAALEDAGVSHAYVVGGQSTKDRDEAVRAFQAGEVRVILVTTAAGGVGITLTRARCAVFLSRPWSLVEALQAEDRVHRIGSEIHDSVDIIDITSRDTVDEAIRQALVGKAEQLGDVLRDPRVLREVLGGKR